MMPFTKKWQPETIQFFLSTSRSLAVVAAVFSIAVATILIANYVQMATLKPLESPALATLRGRYRAAPGDELAAEIRALDLAARRAYFTRQWQSRTGAWMLLAGAAVFLASLRSAGALSKRLPTPQPAAADGAAVRPRGVRIALASAGVVLLAGALSASVLSARLLEPGAPGESARSGAGPAPLAPATPQELTANWPQFRGPGGNGVAGPQDPPTDWDGASGRNILWKAEVPRPGRNSPVVWGDRVFLSGGDESAREVFCWDAETGKLRWRTVVPRKAGSAAALPEVRADVGFAAPTMAVNGRAVFAIFATGDLAAVDLEGKILWTRDLGVPEMNYGYASSLALYGDAVIVQFDQSEGGKLVAIAAADGSTRWEAAREVTSCWASPIVVDTDQGVRIFANGTPFLMAHDPAQKGAVLWQLKDMMGENGPSPAYANGRVIAANQLLSMVAADAKTGQNLWEVYVDLPDVASPLAFDDLVVAAAGYGVVSCLDAASGDVLGRQEFEKGFWASPILAGGRIYALDRTGVMRIFTADRSLKLLASPAIGEPSDMTPAFRGGDIFIRGNRHLFCIRRGARAQP